MTPEESYISRLYEYYKLIESIWTELRHTLRQSLYTRCFDRLGDQDTSELVEHHCDAYFNVWQNASAQHVREYYKSLLKKTKAGLPMDHYHIPECLANASAQHVREYYNHVNDMFNEIRFSLITSDKNPTSHAFKLHYHVFSTANIILSEFYNMRMVKERTLRNIKEDSNFARELEELTQEQGWEEIMDYVTCLDILTDEQMISMEDKLLAQWNTLIAKVLEYECGVSRFDVAISKMMMYEHLKPAAPLIMLNIHNTNIAGVMEDLHMIRMIRRSTSE